MQDEECLNASKQNMCWAPCLILSKAWRVITSREILNNNWRMKRILDEPSCRASMKNSSNKRMIERKRGWKHKVKPCNDLDGASRRDNAENLELRKRKDEQMKSRIFMNLRNKELNLLDETRIRITLCSSFTNSIDGKQWIWHTTYSSWGIEKGYSTNLKKLLMGPPLGLETTNIWYDNEGSEILNEPP